MRYETRLRRLEAQRHRRFPPGHFVSIVHYPWHLGEPDHNWLRGLVCPCGRRGCPELRIGALLPEKSPSTEAWAERAQRYQEERRDE